MCVSVYVYNKVGESRRMHGRDKAGCWKLYQREPRKRAESGEEGKENRDMYDIHGDISLGTLPVRIESDPRRRDTRQSQNI